MNIKIIIIFVLLVALGGNLKIQSQTIFDEKIGECNIERFIMESDTAKVKIKGEDLLDILGENWDENITNNIRGILSLQIIVDSQGNSCLLSIENDTNVKSSVLNLGDILRENLIWSCSTSNISVIYSIKFHDREVGIKRIGINSKNGFTVID